MSALLKMYPYSMASESGKELSQLLNIKRVRSDGDYVPRVGQTILNWGSGRSPEWFTTAQRRGVKILNTPDAVNRASNKLVALTTLKSAGVNIPEFTTSIVTADDWLQNGETVIERHELRGNSGAGIRIVNLDDDSVNSTLSSAPLYTKFIPKTAEFRVHVFRNEVIDYCEKKRIAKERRPENYNKYVCSTEVGWVFVRNDIRDVPEAKEIAIKAVSALGLDFGAVDVIYSEGVVYVLEVNTAPGLMGTTLINYANAFRRFIGAPNLPLTAIQSTTAPETLAPPTLPDTVTLTIDRNVAIKLRELLAAI